MDALKITQCPSALAEFARKHNKLVGLIANLRGTGGIKVVASERNVVVDGSAISGTGGTSTQAVGGDGKLVSVVQPAGAAAATTYPYALGVVTASCTALLNSVGFTMTNSGGKTCTIAFAGLTYDLAIREIEICDSGVTKKMLILGSAPYT